MRQGQDDDVVDVNHFLTCFLCIQMTPMVGGIHLGYEFTQ